MNETRREGPDAMTGLGDSAAPARAGNGTRRGRGDRRAAPAVLAVVALLLASGAAASEAPSGPPATRDLGELSLEQLMDVEVETVSGASRYEQKVTEAPAAISVVTAEEIRTHGYRTLAEVLRDVRGLYATSDRRLRRWRPPAPAPWSRPPARRAPRRAGAPSRPACRSRARRTG